MNILYVNNYACSTKFHTGVKELKYPSNHLWGITEFIDKGFEITFMELKIPKRREVPHKFTQKIKGKITHILFMLRLFLKYFNYDVIYASQTGLIDFFALMKTIKVCRAKLIVVVHHPSVKVRFSKAYNKQIYISRTVFESAKHLPNLEYLFWGPDLNFYDYWRSQLETSDNLVSDDTITFISNGKTGRDYDLFASVSEEINAKSIIICDNSWKDSTEFVNTPNLVIISSSDQGNVVSYKENVRLLLQSQVMVIPVVPDYPGLCGLTSFLDAIALGIPIIMSDNTRIGIDIESEGFGLIYKAGDKKDLKEKMELLRNNPHLRKLMGEKARKFAVNNAFSNFAQNIEEFILY